VNILGMHITHDRENGIITISQKLKIQKLIDQFDHADNADDAGGAEKTTRGRLTPVPTPLRVGYVCTNELTPTDEEGRMRQVTELNETKTQTHKFDTYAEMREEYQMMIGTMSHIAIWGRFDIKQAVNMLARHQAMPSAQDYKDAIRLIAYLKGTIDLKLVFGKQTFGLESILVALVDSDYVGNRADTKSTTGFVIYLWGCPIYTESRKQGAVTKSTTEAELVAASQVTSMVKYVRRLIIEDFRYELPPTPIGEDNSGCIGISYGGGSHKRRRHIRVADSYTYQEAVISRSIRLLYVKSCDNVADMNTKALNVATFRRLRKKLMGEDPGTIAELGNIPGSKTNGRK